VNQEIRVLLALQDDDLALVELEEQVEACTPKIRQLDEALRGVVAAHELAQKELESAEHHEHELQTRLEEQKALHERSVGQLDAVRKAREAAAAMTQAEITRRIVQDLERDLQTAVARVVELRARLRDATETLETVRATQAEERAVIDAEINSLKQQVEEARAKRNASAAEVPRTLLSKYERLLGRRKSQCFFSLEGPSCGNCDMSVPIQRRNMMAASQSIEVCEACGVLLYTGE
jgi:predicted  nucleic acid-binding Zn-ribbon protein